MWPHPTGYPGAPPQPPIQYGHYPTQVPLYPYALPPQIPPWGPYPPPGYPQLWPTVMTGDADVQDPPDTGMYPPPGWDLREWIMVKMSKKAFSAKQWEAYVMYVSGCAENEIM